MFEGTGIVTLRSLVAEVLEREHGLGIVPVSARLVVRVRLE